ncbi:Spindle assembly abnormal protein 6 [Tetrabaena socialis]|uniref:Spindle assembly abnormal protein 6 n=1 Tax=Tetrabaena socialis TaxID=47790 RepID=A0A2J8A8T3_9CHLO|nr:Spindle assembly abnormal protein 6 [Tetrabaena socialis]|eukprot:PNH08928.1 Spindle assembly abnormal protein 6 [Tetrabaena socialis]
MPLLLEESDSKAAVGFDLSTANTLFWRPVPVHVKQQDREDQHEELTIRILTGVARQNHNLRILRVHISSDSDLYFLHTLEVSEEDFQSLKNDQGILVDFASFPGKIISLLERCIAAQPGDSPRFQAVMTARGAESVFKILEINDFKQLPHITLAFRPGNDSVVKQFLAFRLTEVKAHCQELSDGLSKTTDDRDTTSSQLVHCRQQLLELREQYDKHLLEAQAQAKTQQASAHEERIREKSELSDQHERERGELEKRFRDQISGLNTRLGELDSENRKLREIKYELDTKVSELSHKLGSAEGSNRSLDEEGVRLRAINQQVSIAKHELEIQVNEARAKVLALEEKANSQADVIDQQRGRLREMEAAMRQAEHRCADLRDAALAAEARAKEAQAEVAKGNQIIDKLTTDISMAKEKTKRKAAVLIRQEEELQQREQSLSGAMRELTTLSQQAEALRLELGGLRGDNEALRGKVEDSKQQLLSNEQMIRWLNQQVTDAQLHSSGAVVPGSRYSFRPTSTLPSGMGAPSVAATPAVGLLAGPGPSTAYKPHGPTTSTASRYLHSHSAGAGSGTGLGFSHGGGTAAGSGLGFSHGGGAAAGSGLGFSHGGGAAAGSGLGFAGGGSSMSYSQPATTSNSDQHGGGGAGGGGGGGFGTSTSGAGAGGGGGASTHTAFRGLAAGLQASPGAAGSGRVSAMSTPALHRSGVGLSGSYSTSSSLSFGMGMAAPRLHEATPAPSKYGLAAVGGGSYGGLSYGGNLAAGTGFGGQGGAGGEAALSASQRV